MFRKVFRYFICVEVISLFLITILLDNPAKAEAGRVTRISGADRYITAAQIATTNWRNSDNVVLVSGEGYADAVSASVLAKKLDAPILLTPSNALDANTKEALAELEAKKIYIIGGNASISQNVRDCLKSKYTLIELGGSNRYETNISVGKELIRLGVDPSNIIMASGEGFSDALSAAPIASGEEQILLLANNDINYMKSTINFVKSNNSKVTVVGTEYVINDEIFNAVNGVLRVNGGADRFDTNLKVLSKFSSSLNFNNMYIVNASSDDGYADALVASVLAGKNKSPLILLDSDGASSTTNGIYFIRHNINRMSDLTVIGGTGVISNNIFDQIYKSFPCI
ncbi:cell wall-binding repeat-containing protein [Clostridium sp. JS66]|uniref:cell wall-binding repeat-containing protein n=1 Tax=Clostridium sp. JS66 TaxID=3064705 RepID=UPI00298D849E|nr:cell wall-binding repeat-containing protein [Clostridium sp. JS66]WPC40145.1 cell wall-binding repeat-containing protein [Clostridium sp. JS66]